MRERRGISASYFSKVRNRMLVREMPWLRPGRWKGARFNPELLTMWIATNAPFLPKQDDIFLRIARTRLNIETQRADIVLEFPWPDPPRGLSGSSAMRKLHL